MDVLIDWYGCSESEQSQTGLSVNSRQRVAFCLIKSPDCDRVPVLSADSADEESLIILCELLCCN